MGILNGMNEDSGAVHHHGPLAGARAAAVAVIVIPLLAIWLARHLITQALGVLTWAFVALVIACGLAAVLYLFRVGWHRHVMMTAEARTVLPGRPVLHAEALPVSAPYAGVAAVPVAQIGPAPAASIAASLMPAGENGRAPVHLHLPQGMEPEQVAVLLDGLRRDAGN